MNILTIFNVSPDDGWLLQYNIHFFFFFIPLRMTEKPHICIRKTHFTEIYEQNSYKKNIAEPIKFSSIEQKR